MIDEGKAFNHDFFIEAIEKARTHQTKQYISFTKKVEAFDPVEMFASFSKLDKDRIFWGSTNDDFYLAGIGYCVEVSQDDKSFPEMEEVIRQIMEKAHIHNPYQTPGTGMATFGGMTFDSNNKHEILWRKFPQRSLRIPKWIVTKDKHTFYCTVNTYVTEHDQPEQIMHVLEAEEKQLFTVNRSLGKIPSIHSKTDIEPEAWKNTVAQAVNEIQSGNTQKIVLAREMCLQLTGAANISSMLNIFRKTQNNSYLFAIEYDGDCFVGATPERLVRMDKRELLSTCLAGTISRGATEKEDTLLKEELLHDTKNREEHDFVVQMIRGALEEFCVDIQIPETPVIYSLKHLQHLYTPVHATLKKGYRITDVINTLHPTPALGGVPRSKSLAFIRENEHLERGWYGSPIGWFDSNQNGEFAVSIRSGLVRGDSISLFAGCGIMEDSDPNVEYEETMMKFSPMLSVLEEDK